MEEIVRVIFADGTEIEAGLNGNNLITAEEPDFPSDLSVVRVVGDNVDWTFNHAEITQAAGLDNRFWWVLTETPENVRAMRQLQANLEYIAMMTDVELDEEV